MKQEKDRSDLQSAPEGSLCSVHRAKPALLICPLCEARCCFRCWHHAVTRCHACLSANPEEISKAIDWDVREGAILLPFLKTLLTVTRPRTSSLSFARGDIAPALRFALLSFLPIAMLQGIIPGTRLLIFEPGLVLTVAPGSSQAALIQDLASAMFQGLLQGGLLFFALALPYTSLVRAYGDKRHPKAPWRTILYRAWLIPTFRLLVYLVAWALPSQLDSPLLSLLPMLALVPFLLLLSSMRASARMASGLGPISALTVMLVPFALMCVVEALSTELWSMWLPPESALDQAASSAPVN